jgi:pimeloyl-ACP methyl ester carboxylesterase
MAKNKFFEIFKHKWLRVPYKLNVRHQKIKSKEFTTYLFIHGLGATASIWDEIIDQLPADSNVFAADMLGFGESPSPEWEKYDVGLQARMLYSAYKKLNTNGKLVLVGHSLGSLVAIEYAIKYPQKVSRLILCSPPIYRNDSENSKFEYEKLLLKLYAEFAEDKEKLIKLYQFGKKSKIDPTVSVNESNVDALSESLNASIINQNSINDIKNISVPINIVYGIFDPVVITANINQLAKDMPNIKVSKVAASHTINKAYYLKLESIIYNEN